jgi:hypothetical protein
MKKNVSTHTPMLTQTQQDGCDNNNAFISESGVNSPTETLKHARANTKAQTIKPWHMDSTYRRGVIAAFVFGRVVGTGV